MADCFVYKVLKRSDSSIVFTAFLFRKTLLTHLDLLNESESLAEINYIKNKWSRVVQLEQ
jgi:hypothetical protein